MNATETAMPASGHASGPSAPAFIVPAMNARPLESKAMLVTLTIRQWEGRKGDKQAAAKVTADNNATADSARVTKSLISKAALKEISTIASRARSEHYARTLAWDDNGTRIISTVGYLAYRETMTRLEEEFRAAVESFVSGYDAYVRQAQVDLGTLFDATDYPDVDAIRGKFEFRKPRVFGLPSKADFRVDISAEMLEEERAAIAESVAEFTANAVRDVYARIAETVGTMAEKLAAFQPRKGKGDKAQGIFRDSLIQNIRDLIGAMPALNVTDDPRLTALASRMARLTETEVDVLRDHADVRADAIREARAIVADLEGYF